MNNVTVGNIIKYIRTKKNLTIRSFSDITGISPAYICDLEKGFRKGTLETVNIISKKLMLTGAENKVLFNAFYRDHLSLPEDLIYYLIDNDLLDSISILKEKDPDGSNIKRLSLNLENNKKYSQLIVGFFNTKKELRQA